MTKIVSFSLWGENPKYGVGMVRNAEIATKLFPDWECWIHVSGHCEEAPSLQSYLDQAKKANPNVRIISMEARGNWTGMFWRFLPMCQNKFDAVISRDCDSRLGEREKSAVDEWLASDRGFHIMRDHPWHGSHILGGMFGIKKNCLPEFGELMHAWKQEDRWQTDQDFLNAVVYPRVVRNAMIHASFLRMEPHARDFPLPRNGTEFVGQVFDENENTIAEHLTALAKAL